MATWIDETVLAKCSIAGTLLLIPVAKLFVFSLCFVLMFTCVTLGVWAHYLARGETGYRQFASIPNLLKALSVKFDPTWSDLHAFGKSRLLRTTYFWIVFVPIIAKLFHQVEKTLTFKIWSTSIVVTLELPFPWTMFFYGSVSAAIANTIYLWWCPTFLQKYPSFIEFSAAGGSPRQLSYDFGEAIDKYKKGIPPDHLRNLVKSFWEHCLAATPEQQKRIISIPDKPWDASLLVLEAKINQDETDSAFWAVQEFLERQSEKARLSCGAFFVIAFLFFISIFAVNIFYVVSWQLGFKT